MILDMTVIAHFADLQLGFNSFNGRYSRDREQDFYDAWEAAATEAVERGAEIAVIAGDIFENDGSRSSPILPATYLAFEAGLEILLEGGIDVLAVSGNHDTPRLVRPGNHPLAVVGGYKYIANYGTSAVSLEVRGLKFNLLPWVHEVPFTESDFESADVCVLHAPCPVINPAYGGTRQFDPTFAERFEYVALGDWHGFAQVSPNAYYPGSLDRTSFGQADNAVGVIFTTLGGEVEHWQYAARPMYNIEITTADQLEQLLQDSQLSEQAMVRLTFKEVDPTELHSDLFKSLYGRFKFVKEVWRNVAQKTTAEALPQAATLLSQWGEFCSASELSEAVMNAGAEVLQEVVT